MPGVLTVTDFIGDRRRLRQDKTVRGLFLGASVLSLGISALIVISLAGEALTFLRQIELSQLTDIGWFPRRGMFDVPTLLAGTFLVTGLAMFVAIPLGLGSAVYLSEYASPRVRTVVKPALEVLAGIPSVVLGFFAFTVLTPGLIQRIWSDAGAFSLLSAALGIGLLAIPLVASVSEDALHSVPDSLREASYGIGASKFTTVTRVVIPAAVSGIVGSCIVAGSRALGETMVVALAAGGSGGHLFTTDVFNSGLTMTAAMASLATGTDAVKGSAAAFQSLFFVGFLLFVMTFVVNLIADRFVRRVRQRY